MAPHGRGRAGLGGLAGVLLAVLATAPIAGARTFGANLDRQPDSAFQCGDFGFSSCTWASNDLTTGESAFAPTGVGVVSHVSVRVGPATGPMQIVELEELSHYEPIEPIGGFSSASVCCTAVGVSGRFTPQADGITTVPVHLPVREDAAPEHGSGYAVSDFLALSVLAPNVPVPAASTPGDTATDTGWLPAWDHRGQVRYDSPTAASGTVVLLQANWKRAAPVALVGRGARVSGSDAALRLACNLAAGCRGSVSLEGRVGPRTYGSASFSIGGAKRATVDVHLNRAGRGLLLGARSASVWANFQVRGASNYADRARLKLKR